MSWRIGASTGCCTETPIELVLDAIALTGISGVEIGTPPRHFDPWCRSHVETVRARLASTGVTAISMHAPFGGMLDLSDANDHHRSAAIGAILTVASVLKELGGSIVVVHASDVPRAADLAFRLARSAASLRRLHDACTAIDLTLAIETPLPHLVGGAPDEFAWLLEQVGPGARVCIDTGHTTLGKHWDSFIERVGSRIVHVHATDHCGRYDDHLPPGDGTIDWAHIGDSLRKIRYEGWLMLELRCPGESLGEYFTRAAAGPRARRRSSCLTARGVL